MTTQLAPPPQVSAPPPVSRAADNSLELTPGAQVLPPTAPLPPRQSWPSYQQVASPQQALPPQAPLQPAQLPPGPSPSPAPAPQYQLPQTVMPPDPALGQAAHPYNFNDGLQLAGPSAGSGGLSGQPTGVSAPAGSPAWLSPAGAHTPQQAPAQLALAPPPASTVIRDSLVQQGLSVGHYQSDQDLLADLGQSLSNIQRLQQYARIGMEVASRPPGSAQPASSMTTTTPASAPATSVPPASAVPAREQPPEWRDEWGALVRLNPQTGLYEPVDPLAVNPLVVQRANEYRTWLRNRSESLIRNPIETLRREGLDELLRQEREAIKEELRQELRDEQRVEQAHQEKTAFLAQNKARFYQLGQDGQPLVNPITGQAVLTPIGAAAFRYADEFANQFHATYHVDPAPQLVIQYVTARLAADEARGAFHQLPPQPSSPVASQPALAGPGAGWPIPSTGQPDDAIRRAIAMNGAQYQPNQGGSIVQAAQQATLPQNRHHSFTDMLREAAKQKGLLHPSA